MLLATLHKMNNTGYRHVAIYIYIYVCMFTHIQPLNIILTPFGKTLSGKTCTAFCTTNQFFHAQTITNNQHMQQEIIHTYIASSIVKVHKSIAIHLTPV